MQFGYKGLSLTDNPPLQAYLLSDCSMQYPTIRNSASQPLRGTSPFPRFPTRDAPHFCKLAKRVRTRFQLFHLDILKDDDVVPLRCFDYKKSFISAHNDSMSKPTSVMRQGGVSAKRSLDHYTVVRCLMVRLNLD